MVKTITIGNKEYNLKSSAFTMFSYKNQTGRDFLQDINSLNEKVNEINKLPKEKQNSAWLNEFSSIMEIALKLAHIMIMEQDRTFKSYDEWLKELDNLMGDGNTWLQEVLEVGIAPFFGRIQNSQN